MPGERRYLGVGPETTFGVEVAATAWFDYITANISPPREPLIVYEGAGSRMPLVIAPGPYAVEGDFEVGVDLENIGYLFKWGLGNYLVTGNGPYEHSFTPTNNDNLTSFTARIGKDNIEHVLLGATISGITISMEKGFLIARFAIVAQKDKRSDINGTSKSFAPRYFAFRDAVLSIANNVVPAEAFEVSVSNNITAHDGVRFGSRFPKRFYLGGVDVSGRVRLAFESDAELQHFWGGTEASETTVNKFKIDFMARDAVDNNLLFQIIVDSAVWTEIGIPVRGRDRIVQECSFRGLYDTGSNVSIRFILKNNISSY